MHFNASQLIQIKFMFLQQISCKRGSSCSEKNSSVSNHQTTFCLHKFESCPQSGNIILFYNNLIFLWFYTVRNNWHIIFKRIARIAGRFAHTRLVPNR